LVKERRYIMATHHVCSRGFEVEVFSSAAGSYIGTVDWDQCPNCRISGYYLNDEKAEQALSCGSYFRNCMENTFSCPDCAVKTFTLTDEEEEEFVCPSGEEEEVC